MKLASSLLVFIISSATFPAYAQKCPEVGVYYVVRGEDGKPLPDVELKAIIERLPKTVGVGDPTTQTGLGRPILSSIGVNDDGSLRPHSFSKTPDQKVPALLLYGGNCVLGLGELTLELGGKSMRLIFNLELDSKGVRMLVVDSLPFQEGAFALDAPGSRATVPAQHWKKVASRAGPTSGK